MGTEMFHIPIWAILLVASYQEKAVKVNVFAISSFWWNLAHPDGKQFLNLINIVCGKSLMLTSHVWACKVLLPALLCAPGMKK